MRNHACEDQRQPEGKHDRPNCRGGKLHGSRMCSSGMAITVLIVSLHHGIDSRPGLRIELLSPKYIYNQKHDDPHRIDKVPVKRQHFKPFCVHFAKPTAHTEQEANSEEAKPNHDVRCVQTNQGVISRSEQIGTNSKPFFIDEVMPLSSRCRVRWCRVP